MLRTKLDRDYGGDRRAWSVVCLGLAARKSALASPLVVGGTAVSVKTVSVVAAFALVALLSLWWWRASSAWPTKAGELVAKPSVELATPAAPSASTNSVVNDSRAAAPTIPAAQAIDRDRDLHGIVLDPNGKPVAGANVEVLRNELCEYATLDVEHRFDCTTIARTVSDVRGEFALALEPGRALDLTVVAVGFARADFEACHAGERVEVHLQHGSTLAGRVTRRGDGMVLSGARVELGRSNTNSLHESTPRMQTRTDERGDFRLRDITSGTYYVRVFADAGVAAVESIAIPPDTAVTHDFELGGGRAVSGRVIDADTLAPIADAEVAPYGFDRVVRTDANGLFAYYGFDTDAAAAVCVRAKGYARTDSSLFDHQNEMRIENLEVRLQRGRTARGRLVDSTAAPIAGAYVAAISRKQGAKVFRSDWSSTRTGDDGQFEISDVRRDMLHVLWIKKDGIPTLAYTFPKDEAERALIDFGDIRLQPASTIRGVLIDESATPYVHSIIHLRGWNSDLDAFGGVNAEHTTDSQHAAIMRLSEQRQVLDGVLGDRETRTDDLGRFSFADIGAGAYVLTARVPTFDTDGSLDVIVGDGESINDLKFVLPRGLSIEGQVVDANGEGVYSFVSCMTGHGGGQGRTFTDAQGHFQLEGLSSTNYLISVSPQFPVDESKRPKLLGVELRGIAAGTQDLRVVVHRGAAINGTVLDAADEPTNAVRVEARGRDDRVSTLANVDAAGHFELWLRDDQSYDLYAHPLVPSTRRAGEMEADPEADHAGIVLGVKPGSAPVVIRMP